MRYRKHALRKTVAALYEMKPAGRIVSFDWTMYDQGHVVYRPAVLEAVDGARPHLI
jgi:hypothetical protein